ncbi:MAG: prolipoprotein diacylglyceryl transferase family protein [Patescibacteria group bacterium]|nr:prolipoprotein diacylglyceryl transferase family protein [Patescibacteria group bacterium]
MWPTTLIAIGPIAIHSFGLMLFFGVFFGGFVFWQKGREEGVTEDSLMDGWLFSGLVSLLTARAWMVLAHWPEFNSWYRILFLTKFPGLAYEGALLGFWLGMMIWILKQKWSFWPMLEAAVFSQLIVEVFGWLGKWQLIGAVGLIALFQLLKFFEKRYRGFSWYKAVQAEAKPGFLVVVYLWGLGLLQLGLRSRWLGISLMILGLLIFIERTGRLNRTKVKSVRIKTVTVKSVRKKLGFDFK